MATTTQTVASLALAGGAKTSEANVPMIAVKLTDAQIDAAVAVMRSGMLAAGRVSGEFEERFGALTGAEHALACANGTCALQLAYAAVGISHGDRVLCPSWTYIATASMLAAAGAEIVWVDADPETYTIDVADLERKLDGSIKAIAATHIYGTPADIAGVQRVADEAGVPVVYDCAQSHLARFDGEPVGRFGTVCTYSFYATKNMTTGEGGMLTTNDPAVAERVKLLRSHGETQKYIHEHIGFNYRMTDVEAAIGLHQLDTIGQATALRQRNAAKYTAALGSIPGLHAPKAPSGAESVYHLYPVRVDPEAFITPAEAGQPDLTTARDLVMKALQAEGVGCAIHYPRSLTRQPVFEHADIQHQPVSDRLAETLLCIPVHQHLTDEQTDAVIDAMRKVAGALAR
jgi:perosamine synthetase